MMDFDNFERKCYWKGIKCEKDRECDGCEHQIPADEKVNGKLPPVKIGWIDMFGYDGGSYPICPSCGEMPYSTDRCYFCGQRFIQDEKVKEFNEPMPEERMDCLICGGKGTMVGQRARTNGHFHGRCEKCGAVMVE